MKLNIEKVETYSKNAAKPQLLFGNNPMLHILLP